jgi:hypothetical protein
LLSFFPIRFTYNIFGEVKTIPENYGILNQPLAGLGFFLLLFGCLGKLLVVSPIEWTNVILYGEYKLNRDMVR